MAHDDPFRLRVMKAITAQLKTITPANGYTNDLSDYTDEAGRTGRERVFRGRLRFGSETSDPLPMLVLIEDLKAPDPNNGSSSSPAAMNEFRILIQGFVADDPEHALDPAYYLSAEVIKALVAAKKDRFNILGMGGVAPCVTNLSIGQPVHRTPDDVVGDSTCFVVSVRMLLAENLETPFA